MFFGYNTNGLAHHALFDAFQLLRGNGFRGVAITLDHDILSRVEGRWRWQLSPDEIAQNLKNFELNSVIETGARFLLDPTSKHEPNWMNPVPERRALRGSYYERAIELAARVNAGCVSLWSGAASTDEPERVLFERLADELRRTLDFAREKNVVVAFEPEPGMFVDTAEKFGRLLDVLGEKTPQLADEIRLTLDIGHLYCQSEPIAETIRRWAPRLVNIHLDDAPRGRHEHLPLGEGGVDFDTIFRVLSEIRYSYGVYVELSRHSHLAHVVVPRTREFLSRFERTNNAR